MHWINQWLEHAGNPLVLTGSVALFAGVAYLVWRVCRTIVSIGYFVMFTALGFALASGASLALNHQLAPLPVLGAAAVGFGFFVSAVRSKILKAVGAATALIVAHSVGSYWIKNSGEAKEKLLPSVSNSKSGVQKGAK